MSLRGRIVGAVAAITTVTLGGAFLVVYFVETGSQRGQLDKALREVANDAAGEIAQADPANPVLPVRPGPMANDVGPLPRYLAVYAPDGRILATSRFAATPAPALSSLPPRRQECFDVWAGDQHLRGVLVDVPQRPGVHLLVATSREDLDSDESFLGSAMLSVFGVAVLWATLLSSWLVGRFTRGQQEIAAVARRVAAGDLSARVRTPKSSPDIDQLGRDIDLMIDRLGTLVESQQRFIAHAAHELRSPLTTLYGELSHALRKERDAESYRQTIEEALDATRRIKVLTEDLLTLARIGSSGDEPSEKVPVRDIVQAASRSVAAEASEREVQLSLQDSPAEVSGRQRDLERMLRNVLENAIRHSPRAGTVRVAASVDQGHVVLRVSDDGPGIPEADRERIFEPFYRGAAERAADFPGAGLGLAIAREIGRMHGGDVRLVAAGEGAVFEIEMRANG